MAKEERKKEHKLTICEITQETNGQYFRGWTDDEKKRLETGTAADIGRIICSKLFPAGCAVQECHCIIHDKDQREVWDELKKTYVIELKPRHFHCYCKFLRTDGVVQSGTLAKIAAAVGVEPQYIGKAPAGRYGWDNMLSYAVHSKDADKYQYSPDEVATTGLDQKQPDGTMKPLFRPYREIYNERKKDWERGRVKKTAQRAVEGADELEAMILAGQVTKEQVLLTDDMYEVYARNKRRCEDAFDTYISRRIALTVRAMENGEFKVTVVFVTGESGDGKSYFTDALVRRIQKDAKERLGQDWTVCDTAATNPFDDYNGSEIFVMDDLRGFSLTASDWLKLMDPDRIGMGSARYHNKRIAARVIIINSEKSALEFFYYVKSMGDGSRSEAMDQFFRRILARVFVYRVSNDVDVRRLKAGHPDGVQPGERRVQIGHVGRVPPRTLWTSKLPAGAHVTVHYDFLDGVANMDCGEAAAHLSGLVMERNGAGIELDEGEDGCGGDVYSVAEVVDNASE